MGITMEQYNLELLPYTCLRCEKKYFANRRDTATLPLMLCVGCYTSLMMRADHADLPTDEPLGDYQWFRDNWQRACDDIDGAGPLPIDFPP